MLDKSHNYSHSLYFLHKKRDTRLAPDISEGNIKSYLTAKVPSINLKRVDIFKFAPSQQRTISSIKVLVPIENIENLLNKSL